MPSASGPISVEQASDAQFQAWIDTNGLTDLIDDAGIAEWSFDDRVRAINYALRSGRALTFASENNSNNSEKTSESELFGDDNPASQAI